MKSLKGLALVLVLSMGFTSCRKKYEEIMVNFSLFQQTLSVNEGSHINFVKFAKSDKDYMVFQLSGAYFAVDFSDMTKDIAGNYGNLVSYVTTHHLLYNLTPNGDGTFRCATGTCGRTSPSRCERRCHVG